MQLAKLPELVRYWETDYDRRKGRGEVNALPQFVTEIDGLAPHPNALPLVKTHGLARLNLSSS